MATASLKADSNISNVQEPIARDVVLVPSASFFIRSLDLPPGIRPDEILSFVEVTLEEISPFSLNQVYWGYYLPAGSEKILVFAAYRKSLETLAVDDSWEDAVLVVPDFAAALGLKREGAQAVVLEGATEATAVYWSGGGSVPDAVVSRRFGDEEGNTLEEVRKQALAKAGAPAAARIVSLSVPEQAALHKKALAFQVRRPGGAEGPASEIPRPVFWAMDIRDKEFLVTKRKEIRQNRWLWNAVLLFLILFVALGIFEIGLFAGSKLLDRQAQRVEEIAPVVANIQQQEELATLLEDLGGQRLLPFEMLDYINRIRPATVHFDRVSTVGSRGLEAEAVATSSADVREFENRLRDAPALATAEVRHLRSRDGGQFTFTLDVRFREGQIPARAGREVARATGNPPDENPPDPEPETVEEPPGARADEPGRGAGSPDDTPAESSESYNPVEEPIETLPPEQR